MGDWCNFKVVLVVFVTLGIKWVRERHRETDRQRDRKRFPPDLLQPMAGTSENIMKKEEEEEFIGVLFKYRLLLTVYYTLYTTVLGRQ